MAGTRLQRSLRVTLIGLGINTALAIVKMLAGFLGNSHALIADGIESLADIVSSAIVWRGMVVAETPADEDHPYGHGKAEPLAAAMVATMLLGAALWIAVQSVEGITHRHETPKPYTLVVLVVVVVVKEVLYRKVHREGVAIQSSAVRGDAWHHRSDAITSLFAGLGIAVALIGGGGFESADDVAALIASLIIGWNGWRLLRPAMDELMDIAPDPAIVEKVRAVAASVEDVQLVEKCLVRKVGHQHFVDLHIEVDPQMTVTRAHKVAHAVKDRIRSEIPVVRDVLVHVEPLGNVNKS